jgi:exosortase
MDVSATPASEKRREGKQLLSVATLAALSLALWASVAGPLWRAWEGDKSLSHAPVMVLLALWLLWNRREKLQAWEDACPAGWALLVFCAVLHAASFLADVVFLKSFSLIGMTLGAVWFLGGRSALRAVSGPVGLLAFVIPWPTTLVEKLAFPLQLISSAYASLFAGMLGLNIHREGVHLTVIGNSGKPIYSILVAQGCSGLTSLTVLLALGYLIALHTPVKMGWRALMLASILPLTLLANTVRLTLILEAGARYSAHLAQWVHDHEAPVLVFFCSLGLIGLRQAILAGTNAREEAAGRGQTSAALEAESAGYEPFGYGLFDHEERTIEGVSASTS